MSDGKDSGPESALKGTIEGVKGKVKEAAGAITGNDDLQREGVAQGEKAEAQRDLLDPERIDAFLAEHGETNVSGKARALRNDIGRRCPLRQRWWNLRRR